jgi:hypothetical protein
MSGDLDVKLCQHLVTDGLEQPHALFADTRRTAYLCSRCLIDAVEQHYLQFGGSPASGAASCNFSKCSHAVDNQICLSCFDDAVEELNNRWKALLLGNKVRASKLHRVRTLLNRYHDPNGFRPSENESAEDRRTRMDAERIARKRDFIRKNRGFPAQGVLQAQGQHSARIAVVSPGS